MEEVPENGKESPHSAHANGMYTPTSSKGLFFSGFLVKILYAFLISCTPCLLHPPLFDHSKVC
jgi:hypothetical protein